jgi:hypothetical protein
LRHGLASRLCQAQLHFSGVASWAEDLGRHGGGNTSRDERNRCVDTHGRPGLGWVPPKRLKWSCQYKADRSQENGRHRDQLFVFMTALSGFDSAGTLPAHM